jgi:hypothetical protein
MNPATLKPWPALLVAALLATGAVAQQEEPPSGEAASDSEPEQVLTGQELMQRCSAEGGPESEGGKFCMTFMVGLVQTVSQMQLSGEGPMLFCVDPNRVTPEAVRDTAMAWMQRRPERAGEPAYVLVSEALREAYPCPGDPAATPATAPM